MALKASPDSFGVENSTGPAMVGSMAEEPPPPPRIVVTRNGQQFGPYSPEEARQYVASGQLVPGDMAKLENTVPWQTLASLLGLAVLPPALAAAPRDLGQDASLRMILPVGRSAWAIAAGYLGLFALVVVPAPLALIVSLVAIWHIRKHRDSPNPKHGMGRAIFGLITGLLGTAFLLIFLIATLSKH